jgi:hypothetical protein
VTRLYSYTSQATLSFSLSNNNSKVSLVSSKVEIHISIEKKISFSRLYIYWGKIKLWPGCVVTSFPTRKCKKTTRENLTPWRNISHLKTSSVLIRERASPSWPGHCCSLKTTRTWDCGIGGWSIGAEEVSFRTRVLTDGLAVENLTKPAPNSTRLSSCCNQLWMYNPCEIWPTVSPLSFPSYWLCGQAFSLSLSLTSEWNDFTTFSLQRRGSSGAALLA